MKQDLNELIAGMGCLLRDDESFMSELEAKMDLADRVKERNERLTARARKMVLRSILLGVIGAALILLGVLGTSPKLPEVLGTMAEGHETGTAVFEGRGAMTEGLEAGTALFEGRGAEADLQTLTVLCNYSPATYSVLSAVMAACLCCLATLAFSLSSRFE